MTNYLLCVPPLQVTMRAMLIDWLVDVVEEFNLNSETLFLTANIIDRFLSHMRVSRGRLQLVGIGSMLIASKMEEVQPPRVNEFVFICDNTYRSEEVQPRTISYPRLLFLAAPHDGVQHPQDAQIQPQHRLARDV